MSFRADSVPFVLVQLGPDDELPPALRGRLLSSREVAQLFRVSVRTVTAWASDGRLPSVRTPGGHHRFPVEQVRSTLLAGLPTPAAAPSRETRTAIDLRFSGQHPAARRA